MKKLLLGFSLFVLAAIAVPVLAQSNTRGDRPAPTTVEEPVKPPKQRISRRQRLLFKKRNVRHTAQYEFYERLQQVAKQKKRMLRKMAKPQYSDFLYFGHKSKPKKHLPFAMRYCKECGIRH